MGDKPKSIDDKVEPKSMVASFLQDDKKKHMIAVLTLQAVMVLDLLSLMAAYAAGTCRDTFTTVYSVVLVGLVFIYVVAQMAVAHWPQASPTRALAACLKASGNPDSGSSGVSKPEAVEEEKQHMPKQAGLRKVWPVWSDNKVRQDKAEDRFRKVLMLLATFAVSITYVAGLSTPGGFWDTFGDGHRPGDAILKDRHSRRLAVFFGFNTMAFGASLLIIVVLLDTKLRPRNAYVFIVVALLSLIGAYNAGSCRQTDTTFYVASLIPAVVVYILFVYLSADHIHDMWEAISSVSKKIWEALTTFFRKKKHAETQPAEPTDKQRAANKARSLVLLLATLAATITYQAGLDPPGGVWQDNSGGHMAGDPILLTTNPRRYKAFFYCNSVSLVASLVAIVLAQKQLLLKHHVLEAVMILDLFGLIGAYAAGSCRDVNNSIHSMALAGAVLVYVVVHVIFFTLDDDSHKKETQSDKEKDKELVEKRRKRLLLFAIFAATITYQAGLTPPGGFLLQDVVLQSGVQHHAGDPVLLYNFPRRYKAFFYCNSVSFMLSIALILLLVNPNLYRPAIRTHALSVCTAAGLFGLMGSYAAGSTQHLKTSIYVFVLIAVVLVCIAILFLVFLLTGGRTKALGTASSRGDTGTTQEAEMEAGTQVVKPNTSNSNAAAAAAQGEAAAISDTNTHLGLGVTSSNNNTSSTENNEEATKENKREHANRKYLMVLGILVASVTYQAGLEPPGGAWQSNGEWYEAGNPVMHDNRRTRYLAFFYSNSTSFMASIVVILLLLVSREKLIGTAGKNECILRLIEKIIGSNIEERRKKWHVVMNTTIVLDLLGLLGAYAAGSSRRWKTSVYVLLLVIGVLVYMGFHLILSCIIIRRNGDPSAKSEENATPGDSSAKSEANATPGESSAKSEANATSLV